MPKQQPSDQKTVTRKGSPPLKVYCLPSERDQITANAQAVGLTVSTYLLRVGAGYEIKSTLDSQLVAELAKVNADLGRLGGLLKLWLTDDKKLAVVGNAWTQGTVRALLKRLEDTQAAMLETVRRI
ncbi:conjugal transfer transcriptional regulator TraJ [Pseudomonas fragi]|uniref:conjugal transfer transcriptional regulator TraJ n=1 Tax=Pseudomonas TaxID=286 RepID=UPI000E7171F6|nr:MULTISPECIES: conjugal transfer transcriptional regulator TraJ [Pseudomonas]AOA09224.1 conjugal transfer protein TrbJ [Pseudomonas sp. TMW 2.1634]MBM1202348.1 conjugal transfer transcriptional regulator TraJ [Pseudomonas fragi]MDY7572676.1 conjugal transfer transcriptional regulator TraJ [Pseudomonas sp. CCC4.1]MEB0143190.1 conjugal transfer transcriptional regulator TraJ [Pseudomonas sp. CCC4.1]